MKKSFLILGLLPLMASAQNYFTEGTKWNYIWEGGNIIITSCTNATYSLEGRHTVDGYECSSLYLTTDYNPDTRKFMALVRTEGDKVLFLPTEESTQWYTLYDFSLQPGERFMATSLTNAANEPESGYLECVATGVAERYGDFPSMYVLGERDLIYVSPEEATEYSNNLWLKGVGGVCDFQVLTNYFGWAGQGGDVLLNASNGANLICQLEGLENAGATGSVFQEYTIWMSEIFGENGNVTFKEWLSLSRDIFMDNQRHYEIGNSIDRSGHVVSIEDNKIYRLSIDNSGATEKELAYDFTMQPGDVRRIAPITGKIEESTWMRCESRKPSVDFPGRDEIKLAEFADEAMTQFLGRGSWIDGIGTIHGVSCNNRFDRSMAQRQMFRIIDNGHVAWERSLASIDNVDAAPTLDARVIGRTVIASEPFTLYSIDGRRIASGEGSVEVAAPGIYIVATPSASAKVAVSL